MAAKFILAGFGVLVVLMGVARIARKGQSHQAQGRIWLLVGGIFAAVSAYLFTLSR